ncbi:GerAB/ArcD/ProY family transporter [Clostridium guangxiense]|uniref:GerAB/ArcD/ProY family transporter n=1 Tax=Clostridium guangxiense TaxID=1662055 RepID=UPI001E285D47|nr:endospore germination permease [Clostridium guangxiense]MCD2347966.1 endospore germination permease [Clostridium guangxiense]
MASKSEKFGTYETVALVTMAMVAKILYTSTSAMIKTVGTAAWYMTIISCIISIIFFILIYKLMMRFPGKDIFEIYEAVLGKFLGKFVTIIFSMYLMFYCSSSIREFLEMIKSYSLPYTPPSVIIGTFILVSALLCYKGIENIARFSYLIFYPVLLGICLILVLAIPYYKFNYIKPYLGYGFEKTAFIGFLRSSAYQEVTLLCFVVRSIHGVKNLKKTGLIAIVLSGVIFAVTALCCIMDFGYGTGQENISGVYQLSRMIYYNRYFQRIEAIFLFIWVLAAVQNAALSLYFSIIAYCKSFNIKGYRNLILPFCFFGFMGALIPSNFPQVTDINMIIIRQYGLFFSFVPPVIVLVISMLLKKGGEKNNV